MEPRRSFSPLRLFSVALAALSLILGPAALAAPPGGRVQAAPAAPAFQVNSTLDAVDGNPGDGLCETSPGGGVCTLRAAIMEANHTPGGGATVSVPAGTYVLALTAGGDDEAYGDLDITASMELAGAGADYTFLDADYNSAIGRVLEITNTATVAISGVTVQHGYQRGGIQNLGTLSLSDVTVADNFGPGIENRDATLALTDSRVLNNVAPYDLGGGIQASGSVAVSSSVISGNVAREGGGILNLESLTVTDSLITDNLAIYGAGGGIFSHDGHITVTNSSLSRNGAYAWGGGIFISDSAHLANVTIDRNTAYGGAGIYDRDFSQLSLTNSTISGNHADYYGGGIFNEWATTALVDSSTITGNYADNDLDGNGRGGGVYNVTDGYIAFTNSIVAGNFESAINGGGLHHALGDCYGELVSLGNNLLRVVSDDCAVTGGGYWLADPLLGPLADNGGPTLTHLPLFGSPAIDAGAGRPDTDQRGVARPVGAACDIGAVEYEGVVLRHFLPLAAR